VKKKVSQNLAHINFAKLSFSLRETLREIFKAPAA